MSKLQMVKDRHLGGYIRGGDPGTWCPHLWSWAVEHFQARSMMDVGCGEAHSTKYFHELGCDVIGVEGCEQAIRDSVLRDCVFKHDYCDDAFLPPYPVDLVWSCEFLEHIHERYVDHVLKTFSYAQKAVLITHAFPGQEDGHHHVNCRPTSYWIQKIEALGFTCDEQLTHRARTVTLQDYAGVNHFARSGLLFCRNAKWKNLRRESQQPSSVTFTERLKRAVAARCKSFRIHNTFRRSPEFREHMRRRKESKRAANRNNQAA